ncbi:MAG TPA: DinB family protein [Pyrinomonadaceae bacterium]|nr:DinB family protein [Pyrinomonadaceae bacterium]
MKLRLLLILCCLFVPASASFAQTAPEKTPDMATDVRNGFNEVNDWVLKAAEMVPADKYNYKPVDTVRTFGQLIAHVTDSYNYFCAHGAGNKVEWTTPVEKGATDKETVLPKLKEAAGKCNAAYGSANPQLRPLFMNVGHTNLHYGNIITYMRMMGLKPPSS